MLLESSRAIICRQVGVSIANFHNQVHGYSELLSYCLDFGVPECMLSWRTS
jgi:hypothetical protein